MRSAIKIALACQTYISNLMHMERENTFESALIEFLSPIIEKALERVLARTQGLRQEPVKIKPYPDLFDIKMTAEYLHLAVPTIYGLVQRATIPFYKKGKRLYFKKEDLEKWIETGRKSTIEEIGEGVRQFYLNEGLKKKDNRKIVKK